MRSRCEAAVSPVTRSEADPTSGCRLAAGEDGVGSSLTGTDGLRAAQSDRALLSPMRPQENEPHAGTLVLPNRRQPHSPRQKCYPLVLVPFLQRFGLLLTSGADTKPPYFHASSFAGA